MLFVVLLAPVLIALAYTDCVGLRISNRLVLLISVIGCAKQFQLGGSAGLYSGALGFGLGMMITLPLYLFAGMGGGDLKLFSVCGLFLGPPGIWTAAAVSALIAGTAALLLISRRAVIDRSRRRSSGFRTSDSMGERSSWRQVMVRQRMPLAPAIAIGVLVTALVEASDELTVSQRDRGERVTGASFR